MNKKEESEKNKNSDITLQEDNKSVMEQKNSHTLSEELLSAQEKEELLERKICPEEYRKLKEKANSYDELWQKYLRLCADFENARKRWERDRIEVVRFATYEVMKELLVILDELEHALQAIDKHSTIEEIKKGVELTHKNLLRLIKKEGIKPIEAKGKKFDPHLNEIVGQREDNNVEEHTVLDEVQKGYLIGDKVLRTAKVIISKKGEEKKEETQDK